MSTVQSQPMEAGSRDTVVLLHGLGRTRISMLRLATELERDGFHVVNLSYPSRTRSLEALADRWLPAQLAKITPSFSPAPGASNATPQLHFVTHSMGGILLRLHFQRHPAPRNLGRVVMLAPPNGGSEVSDRLNAFSPFRWFTGINGRRLGTGSDAVPQQLGDWPAGLAELGIIAGDRSLNPLFSAWLPGPDDGKVSVAATRLAGARDHIVLPHSHPWLAWRRDTIVHVARFLHTGGFSR